MRLWQSIFFNVKVKALLSILYFSREKTYSRKSIFLHLIIKSSSALVEKSIQARNTRFFFPTEVVSYNRIIFIFLQYDSLNRTVRQLDIVNPRKQIKIKRHSNSGTLRILHCHVDSQFSLIDYVRGNCVIRMVCAIDFTMSNGPPLTKDSLHSMDERKVSLRIKGTELCRLCKNDSRLSARSEVD